MYYDNGLSKKKKIIIISMMSAVIVILAVMAILLSNKRDDSRTIMIYMAGNNLESNIGLASSDLNGIDPSKINLEKTHVLLYTGGAKVWHNFVNPNENAIYELKANGFEKVKTYPKSSMGDSTNLTNFLNYSYSNYHSGKYDLIFWDHGMASAGSISDENTESDYLTLIEISNAFKNSKFSSTNKIETMIFRTCLNGTLEVASILTPYANYMVASEEITVGANGLSVLSFINDVSEKDNGKKFGDLFVESYKIQVKGIEEALRNPVDSTYSVIDLNKMNKLYDKMNSFFTNVDVKTNYKNIARSRSAMHQYAVETGDVSFYDTVDLYELIDNLKIYSPTEADNIKKLIKNEIVVSNWSTNTHSNGLSIYFPYYGDKETKQYFLEQYNYLSASDNYKDFINKFYDEQNDNKNVYSFNIKDREVTKKDKEFKLKLTEEEQENYSKAGYIIFRKEEDGLFTPIFVSDNAKLDKKGYLTTKIEDNVISVVDETTNERSYVNVVKVDSSGKYDEYNLLMTLMYVNWDEPTTNRVDSANVHLVVDDKKDVYIDKIYLKDKTEDGKETANPAAVKIEDYTEVLIQHSRYNILDENGNFMEPSSWVPSEVKHLSDLGINDFHFESSTLDDGDYYCVFKIFDSQNNAYYSNLISIK